MCWNLKVSLYAAAYGFGVAYYLSKRHYSFRDPWYAKFLISFTLTQLLDAFFWYSAATNTSSPGVLECNSTNRIFSKWVVSAALFYQVWAISEYPGTVNAWARPWFKLLAAGLTVIMGLIAGCTTIIQTKGGLFPPSPTLLYWGIDLPKWLFTCAWGINALPEFMFIRPWIYCFNILCVLGINLCILKYVDGTTELISKLCFYCLLLSVVWLSEPLWAAPGGVPPGDSPPPMAEGSTSAEKKVLLPASSSDELQSDSVDEEEEA